MGGEEERSRRAEGGHLLKYQPITKPPSQAMVVWAWFIYGQMKWFLSHDSG